MKPKKAIKELEKQLRKEPDSLVLRLKLAAVYREVGRTEEAVKLYGSVAVVYHQQGRLSQAIAVCKSVLEIDPSQRETQALLAELDRMRAAQGGDSGPVHAYAPPSAADSPASTQRGYFSPDLPDAPPLVAPGGTLRQVAAPPIEDQSQVINPVPIPSLAAAITSAPAPSPVESERRKLADEFAGRSGMTPHSEPNPFASRPVMGPRRTAPMGSVSPPSPKPPSPPPSPPPPPRPTPREPAPRTSTPLPRMPRTTQRMSSPPMRRSSGPLLTPTPLPRPLALHEIADDGSEPRPLPPLAPPVGDEPRPARVRPPTSPPPVPRFGQTLRGQLRVPLPGPHDDDATSIADDDDALTRIADDTLGHLGEPAQNSDDARTTLAPDPSSRPSPLPRAPVDDDDAPTRIADESGGWPMASAVAVKAPAPPPPRRAPSVFERDTRPIETVSPREVDAELDTREPPPVAVDEDDVLSESRPYEIVDDEDDDEPTHPPMPVLPSRAHVDIEVVDDEMPTHPPGDANRATGTHDIEIVDSDDAITPTPLRASARELDPAATGKLLPAELRPFQRGGRLIDVEPSWPEETTDPRDGDDGNATDVSAGPGKPDDSLSVVPAFDKPFAETISALGPDGSTIEGPLSFFSDLPDDALAEMAEGMTLCSYAAGELILSEGEPGDACYVIASGEVRVLKRDPMNPRGDLIEVARLGSGALFGEFALLADRRRHASVQAVANSEIYEIPRRLLRELAATFPDVGPMLEVFYRERLLANVLATAPFFRSISEERRGDLLSMFRPHRAESGEHIVSEGERAGGLYLIVLGSVEITKRVSAKRSVLLATLGEGAYFGEMSLLKGGVASATVTAAGPTELAMLPPKAFYEVVADNPLLWDEVRREANRRKLENNQIVTGETNVV